MYTNLKKKIKLYTTGPLSYSKYLGNIKNTNFFIGAETANFFKTPNYIKIIWDKISPDTRLVKKCAHFGW